MTLWILPKNKENALRILPLILSTFCSFFGRIVNALICFRDLVTFTRTGKNREIQLNQQTNFGFIRIKFGAVSYLFRCTEKEKVRKHCRIMFTLHNKRSLCNSPLIHRFLPGRNLSAVSSSKGGLY